MLADTPGHVQYTRNTVTGASTAELAVLLVDARHGVVEQTRRHAAVLALLRVPRLVLAINKIDLVDYDEAVLTAIGKDFAGLTRSLGFADDAVVTIPLSALVGDNVVERSARTPWYDGPTLLGHLESVPVTDPDVAAPFRMPVQYVIRPRTAELPDYRGLRRPGRGGHAWPPATRWWCCPAAPGPRSPRCDTADGPLERGHVGRSVTVLLADDIDISRGDLLAAADAAPPVDSRAGRHAVLAGRQAAARRRAAAAQARHPDHPGDRRGAGRAAGHRDRDASSTRRSSWRSTTSPRCRCAPPTRCRSTTTPTSGPPGSFLLIDPPTGNTLAAGLVGNPLCSPS